MGVLCVGVHIPVSSCRQILRRRREGVKGRRWRWGECVCVWVVEVGGGEKEEESLPSMVKEVEAEGMVRWVVDIVYGYLSLSLSV